VLGKDSRGRSRSVGTVIPKTKVKACAIAQKRLKHVYGENDELKMRVGNLEGTVGNLDGTVRNLSGQMEVLINMVGNIEQNFRAPVNSSAGGGVPQFNVPEFVASQLQNTTNVGNNQNCEILNSDLDIIATGIYYKISIFSCFQAVILVDKSRQLYCNRYYMPRFYIVQFSWKICTIHT